MKTLAKRRLYAKAEALLNRANELLDKAYKDHAKRDSSTKQQKKAA